jgi:signal transduction histidine kinase/HAMP domain-containing protein
MHAVVRPSGALSRWSSIVWKLTVFVGVVVALDGALLIGVTYLATKAILEDQVYKRLRAVVTLRQELLASTLHDHEQRVLEFASSTRVRLLLSRRADEPISPARFRALADPILANSLATIRDYIAIWIEDEAGQVIASSGPANLISGFSGAKRSLENPAGGLALPPRRLDGAFGVPFAATVRSADLKVIGTIMVLVDFSPTASILMDTSGLDETGEVLVGVKQGNEIRLITPTRGPTPVSDVLPGALPALEAAMNGKFGSRRSFDYRGEDVFVAYRPLGRGLSGWGLVAKIDAREVHAPVRRLQWLLLMLGLVALVLGLAASNLIARRFANPIRELVKTSSAVASGDLSARSEIMSSDELGALGTAFNVMTEELERSHSNLERRISERTLDLEAARDMLDSFFRISTSRLDPDNFDKTLDSVLHFCSRLGYDLAMISFVDRDAGVIRAARATGSMSGLVELTVRSIDGGDILADVVRQSRAVIIPDSRTDSRCDRDAVAVSGIRGQIVVPLVSDTVLGTLQVASQVPLDAANVDLRPLETLANHTARALTALRQVEEIRRLNQTQELDIRLRKKAERRLAAQYETTRALAESDSPSESVEKILQTICECLDWDLGAFWRVDSPAERLRCAAVWRRPGVQASALEEMNHNMMIERGGGVPGRVWDRGEPEWIPELTADSSFLRPSAAVADGFHTAFAVPILLRDQCLGVLEFFSLVSRPADRAILEMMGSLGTQIGQSIDRHQMRARVVQSEKLASLGMLSAGVAHEINNPLAFIATNLAVLERDSRFLLALLAMYQSGDDGLAGAQPELHGQIERFAAEFDLVYVRENMGTILERTRNGVKRVADIVQNLRGFTRLDQAEDNHADINEAISAALVMLRGRLDRALITIEEHKGELPLVAGSPAQLNQVFLNLLVNAMQAIEAVNREGGRITITTADKADEIWVEVSDNGCGIPEENLPRIFTPFFTTKEIGDGTGLGLSISYGIIDDHGGRLQVESKVGEGTCFRVILPTARP